MQQTLCNSCEGGKRWEEKTDTLRLISREVPVCLSVALVCIPAVFHVYAFVQKRV